jgi:diaminopimelate epimerase
MIEDMEKKVYRHRESLPHENGDRGETPRYRVTIADPAGNLTALIEAADDKPRPVAAWTDTERQCIVRRVMREQPDVEQTGFVLPGIPEAGGKTGRFWHLEMAGGEFCGNAARSFGLWVARKQGLCGSVTVPVTVSGAKDPLTVLADTDCGEAEVALPPPRKMAVVRYRSRELPAVMFDGITHVIMEGIKGIGQDTDETALTKTFFAVKETARKALVKDPVDEKSFAAFGVLFYDTAAAFLRPAVFVSGIESFVFEKSCGSGSAAFACYRAQHLPDGEHSLLLSQPGGTIKTRVVNENGKPGAIFIGGAVSFRQ